MEIYQALKHYFGYDEFKEGQEKLIGGILSGRDGLGIMPTGGGKSLCYQLPAVLLDGVTIVISPLISLMKDQVDSLNEIGIPATFINSSLEDSQYRERLEDIKKGSYKIIYLAPEGLNSFSFLNLVSSIQVSLIAIDEAHCISQWGHDFRPSYRQIPTFIRRFSTRPRIACYTATATKEVVKEIKDLIGLKNPIESIIGFDRPNLLYEVIKVSDKYSYVKSYIENNFTNKSGIIYCATRKTVESLAQKLNEDGFSALPYHGGMESIIRQENQDSFIYGEKQIIVATNAFGMGIDKPDVRFIIHYNMPQNMEAYYQEAGRAGRDGQASRCTLMYSPSDIVKQKLLIQNGYSSQERENILYENLQYLVDYCHTNDCLRAKILEYFGEVPSNENCSYCGNCLDQSEMLDISLESQKILSCIYRVEERYGVTTIIQVLRGSRNKRILEFGLDKLSTYGIMKEYSESSLREMIMTLVARDYITMTSDKFPILKLNSMSGEILRGNIVVKHKKHLVEVKKSISNKKTFNEGLKASFNEELFEKLKSLRYQISQEKSLAPFMVFHDSSLVEMSSFFPDRRESFLKIKGVGIKKYESYGESFIKTIKDFLRNNNLESLDIVPEEKGEDSLKDRYELTYQAYLDNLSLKEISKLRSFRINTIINHLSHCEKSGKSIDWSRFIDDPRKENLILASIEKLGSDRIKLIKESLPEEITYEDINIVIAKHKL